MVAQPIMVVTLWLLRCIGSVFLSVFKVVQAYLGLTYRHHRPIGPLIAAVK